MKKIIKIFFRLLKENLGLGEIRRELKGANDFSLENFLKINLYENEKYLNNKRLNRYEFKVFSQGGEDGILEEIFNRIGITTNKVFVEFGIGDGKENNTLFLFLKGWNGYWIDGNGKSVKEIKRDYDFLIRENRLQIKHSFVTAENIEGLFSDFDVPRNFDFLSIDIDGNDYWVWKAIKKYSPRVVAIEYNSNLGPAVKWVQKYKPDNIWNRTSYFGASLKSLELLGSSKGYKLVGCSFSGVNAFFVREDLIGDKFFGLFASENHFEPKRTFLLRVVGDKRFFGEFEEV